MGRKQLRGIFAAMCTPLKDAGETIDDGRMREHIDYLIEAGVHGIVLNSGTGEFAYMSEDESRHIIEVGTASGWVSLGKQLIPSTLELRRKGKGT